MMPDEPQDWLDKVSEKITKAADAAQDAWDRTADARKEDWRNPSLG